MEPPDALERMMPSEEIKRDVLALKKLLERSRTIRVESEVGTNLHYTLKDYPVFGQYGMADEPGKWDHWPSALVSAYPDESSATGIVVLDRGDIIFPFHSYVRTPITITVEAGRVLDIEGELDAKLMRDYLASWGADDVYGTSHIGFGLHPNAQWSALEFYDKDGTIGMDARSLRGGFIFSTGPHRYAQRYVEAHIDVVMHGCTVLVDEQLVIDQGEYVAKL